MDKLQQIIRVTHPFHPWFDQQFELATHRRSWGGRPVVDCLNAEGHLVAIPLSWTDAANEDPFVVLSLGRAHFRIKDLLTLLNLLDGGQK